MRIEEVKRKVLLLLPDEKGDSDNREGLDEAAAAVVFSHLVEPGDRFIGALQETIGFASALELVASNPDSKSAASALTTGVG
jgi:hypothetical protein